MRIYATNLRDTILVRGGWRRGWRCCRSCTVVNQIFQFLAGLEEWNLLCRSFHPVACFRIPAHARLALAREEAAKPTYFDLVAYPQRAHHAIKDRVHNHFAVFAGEFRQPGNFFDQVSFRHKPWLPVYNLLKFKGFCASTDTGTYFRHLFLALISIDSRSR